MRDKQVEINISIEPIRMYKSDWFHLSTEERIEMVEQHISDGGLRFYTKHYEDIE